MSTGDWTVHRHLVPAVRRALEFWRDEKWRRNRLAWPAELESLIAEAEAVEQAPMFEQIANAEVQTVDAEGSEPVEWITADEAARRLGCSHGWVCRLVKGGKLRSAERTEWGIRVDAASVDERAERLARRRAA
ncbi:MAG TPA: hypothetical protein VGE38_16845 [Nocardioides sp.]|uniref:hypothetical protein n=1 Tax=Nocardioides sp. TaxID=35761 RepID=UPI002ED8CF06